jgi:hypothetical protein
VTHDVPAGALVVGVPARVREPAGDARPTASTDAGGRAPDVTPAPAASTADVAPAPAGPDRAEGQDRVP